MIDLNRAPLRMGWKPFLGQAPAMMPAVTTVPAPTLDPEAAPKSYLEGVKERLAWFGLGTGVGLPVGILTNVAFKSLRRNRKDAAQFTTVMAVVGLMAALAPIDENRWTPTIARLAGVFTGSGLADMILPSKKTAEALAKAV